MVINVRSIYGYTILTQDAGWKTIYDNVIGIAEKTDEVITLDFQGIKVENPGEIKHFIELFMMDNIKFVFYNIDCYNSLRIKAVLCGLDESKITNVEVGTVKKESKDEKKVRIKSEELIKYIRVNGDTMELVMKEVPWGTSYGNSQTAIFISVASRKVVSENKDIKKFILDITDINVKSEVLETIAQMIVDFKRDYDIDVIMNIDDPDTIDKIKLHVHIKKETAYSYGDKVKAFSKLKKGTVGILIVYKNSRALDEFGRKGHGEVRSARIALFEGMKRLKASDGDIKIYALFRTFNKDTFYTKEHWMLENDGEELNELDSSIVKKPVENMGLYSEFIGEEAHFARPIQKDNSDNIIMRCVDDSGKVVAKEYTIIERIETVFKEFGVEYDEESLEYAKRYNRQN